VNKEKNTTTEQLAPKHGRVALKSGAAEKIN
jgi:hypothetical protein